MKKFKKVLICAAACATACSVAALTACGGEETHDEGLSADVAVSTVMSSEALAEHIAKFENQSSTSINVNGGFKMTKMGEETIDMALATISAKVNLADGNADVNLAAHPMFFEGGDEDHDGYEYGPSTQAEGEEGSEEGGEEGSEESGKESGEEGSEEGGEESGEEGSEEGGEEGGDAAMREMNVYLRNWVAFYPDTDEAGDGDFNYMDLAAVVGESANMVMSEVVAMLAGGSVQDNAMLLTLANTTDSIVVDETAHTIKLDINKMVYGLYDYIRQIANNLTEYTTVSGLLKCSAVRYYIEAYLGDMTGEELFETVMEIMMGGEAGGTTPFAADVAEVNPFAAIMPVEGEKAYDYILRMVNSQDFADIMNMEKPVGATKIVDLIGEDAAAALNMVKGMVAMIDQMQIITEDAITIPQMPGMSPAFSGASVSGLELVYTFDEENVLQSVDFGGKISTVISETAVEIELALSVGFASEEITAFENIGSYTVNYYDRTESTMIVKTVNEILNSANAQ